MIIVEFEVCLACTLWLFNDTKWYLCGYFDAVQQIKDLLIVMFPDLISRCHSPASAGMTSQQTHHSQGCQPCRGTLVIYTNISQILQHSLMLTYFTNIHNFIETLKSVGLLAIIKYRGICCKIYWSDNGKLFLLVGEGKVAWRGCTSNATHIMIYLAYLLKPIEGALAFFLVCVDYFI